MKTHVVLDSIYAKSEDVVTREVERDIVIIPFPSVGDTADGVYTLNSTGREVWRRLDGKRSVRDIAGELTAAFSSRKGEIERDVIGIVKKLLGRGILVEVPDTDRPRRCAWHPASMVNREFDIQSTRELSGWAYHEMKWVTEREAKEAGGRREELLQSLSGRVNSSFLGNKIHSGALSPGCMTCGRGTWSCLYIDSLCTANCFFCPQDRRAGKDRSPTESGLLFDRPEDYVDYLKKFKFKGVGISGGEPLLIFGKLLSYITEIKRKFGTEMYLWLYTNGDLIDAPKLKALKKAGLDEIRFNIAARAYDLHPVERSVGVIDTVTVEIPAIPEDFETVKKSLHDMQAMGVAHVNLHQLSASRYCYRKFNDRRYTFLHQPEIPVLESEMTALRLLDYALRNGMTLPINLCSAMYKHRLQKTGYRQRIQPFIREPYQGVTESGFVRILTVQGTPADTRKRAEDFVRRGCARNLWLLEKGGTEISFHHSLMKYVDFGRHPLILTYVAPQLMALRDEEGGSGRRIRLNPKMDVYVEGRPVYETGIVSPAAIRAFRELYIEGKDRRDVLERFCGSYELKTKADMRNMMAERDLLNYLREWELIGAGPTDIY